MVCIASHRILETTFKTGVMSLASWVKTLRPSEVAQGPTWTGAVLGSEHGPGLTAEPTLQHHGSSFYNLLPDDTSQAWHWGHECEQDSHGPRSRT